MRTGGAALVGLVVGVAVFVAALAGWGWWHAHMESRRG